MPWHTSGVSERLHLLSQMMLVPLAWRSTEISYSAANEYCAKHYARAAPYFAEDTRTEHVYDARQGVFDDDATTLRPASLSSCGFALRPSKTAVADWDSLEQVSTHYLPELREKILAALGEEEEGEVSQVVFWNPMLRGEWDERSDGPEDDVGSRGTTRTARSGIAAMAHIDTDMLLFGGDCEEVARLVERNSVDALLEGQPRRGARLSARGRAVADALRRGQRFAVVNAWRNIDAGGPVRRAPLAVMATDYGSGAPLRVLPEASPSAERSRWYVFPRMTPEEVLLFKQYDRHVGRPSDLWHCALPGVAEGADAPPRRSFEVRALVVFDELVPSRDDRFAGKAMPRLTHRDRRGLRGALRRAVSMARRCRASERA